MLMIGTVKRWVPYPAAGAEFLLSPLATDDRDAFRAQVAALPEAERAGEFSRLVVSKALHGWKGIAALGPDGAAIEAPFTPENVSEVLKLSAVSDFIQAQAFDIGLAVANSIDEAGNVLSGASTGTAAAAPAA